MADFSLRFIPGINDSCNWTLYWADKSVCYLLKCPSLEVCENITVQDLMFDKGTFSVCMLQINDQKKVENGVLGTEGILIGSKQQ